MIKSMRRLPLDLWLAAAFTVLAFVPPLSAMGAQVGDLPPRPHDWFAVAIVPALTLPLAVRTRWPAACLAVIGTAFALYQALPGQPQFATVTVYLALYSAGAHQRRFRGVVAGAATVAYAVLALVLHQRGSTAGWPDLLIFYLLLAVCWLLGAYVRHGRAVEAERRRLAAVEAAAAERTRIARDLHDVVTHHVTAMVVRADATQVVAESPEQVRTALTSIFGTGRRALSDLRSLLDVLEEPGSIRDLVDQTRQSGQPIELVEETAMAELPGKVRQAVYRVAQEGLTNAVKYATGRATVIRTSRRDGHVEIEVTNAAGPHPVAPGLSGGRGITGLRDRIAALGGTLVDGPLPDGGFRLLARIPA